MHDRSKSWPCAAAAFSAAMLLVAACGGGGDRDAAGEAGSAAIVLAGRIIDGTGAPAIEDGVVVLEGGRIRCVGPARECRAPRGARRIDAGGGTILPGLIDLHVHARAHYLWTFLAAGITTARDLNNRFEALDAMGADGPDRARLVWAGPLVDGPGSSLARMGGQPGADFLVATTPAEASAVVDTLAARGVGVVKLYEKIPFEAYRAAADRARERGLPVATDLGVLATRALDGSEVDALQAIEAGVTSIEHFSGFALAYRRLGGDPRAEPLDAGLIDRLARAVVENGIAVVPTINVYRSIAEDTVAPADLPLGDQVPDGFLDEARQMAGMLPPVLRARAAADLRLGLALTRRVHELGGRIGAGSDTPAGLFNFPGGGLHRELELLVGAGLAPLDAIHAATGAAAAILGRDDLGVIAPGKVADLVVVDGNPAERILATRHVRWVVKDGRPFTREEALARQADAPPPPIPPAAGDGR